MSSLATKGKKAFLWNSALRLSTSLSSFVIGVILARMLPPEDFGTLALIMVAIAIFTSVSNVGLSAAIIQTRHIKPIHLNSVFYFIFFINALFFIAIQNASKYVAAYYGTDNIDLLLQAASIILIINSLSSVSVALLRKRLELKKIALVKFSTNIIGGCLGIWLALYGYGIWSLIIQVLIIESLNSILLISLCRWAPELKFSFKALKKLWTFGFFMFLANLLDAIFSRLDVIIFGKIIPIEQLGQFQRAKTANMFLIGNFSTSLLQVLFPMLSKISSNTPRFTNLIHTAISFVSFISFLIVGVFYYLGEILISIIYGPQWIEAGYYFKIIILSSFALPLGSILVTVLSSRGKSTRFLIADIFKKTVIGLHLFVGIAFGFDYFVWGLIVRAFASTCINLVFASKELDVKLSYLSRPIFIQLVIFSILLLIIESSAILNETTTLKILAAGLYGVSYLFLSYLFNTLGYQSFITQLKTTKTIFKKK